MIQEIMFVYTVERINENVQEVLWKLDLGGFLSQVNHELFWQLKPFPIYLRPALIMSTFSHLMPITF